MAMSEQHTYFAFDKNMSCRNETQSQNDCRARISKLKDKLLEKQNLLRQLEQQEKGFLGTSSLDQDTATIDRIEFTATAKKNYFLVPGREETLIPSGMTFTVFGQLKNRRWRCFVDKKNKEISPCDSTKQTFYPLIGSVPTSVILELSQPNRTEYKVGNIYASFRYTSTETASLSTVSCHAPAQGALLSNHTKRLQPEENLSHELSTQSCTQDKTMETRKPKTGRSIRSIFCKLTLPSEKSLIFPKFHDSSTSSTIFPETPTESTIAELNLALESLSRFTQRSRISSGASNNSRTLSSSE